MKQLCKAFLVELLGLSGVGQESRAPRVAIPLIASDSHHQPISVAVESLNSYGSENAGHRLESVAGGDLPLELGLLIDVSNSQRDAHLDDAVKAMKQSVDKAIRGTEDRVFFLTFDSTPHATEWLKKEQLPSTEVPVRIGGGTALYDALATACKQRMGPRDWQRPTRRVLLLISDGEDNLSHITRDAAAVEMLRAGAMLFTINSDQSPGGSSRGEQIMEAFSKLTGGRSFSPRAGNEIPKVFAGIEELIEGMYYLRYIPPDASKGTVREVEVKLAPKEKVSCRMPGNTSGIHERDRCVVG